MCVCVIRVVVIDRKKNVATKRTSEKAAALSVETDPISCSLHLFSLMILNFLYYHLNPTIGPTSLSLSTSPISSSSLICVSDVFLSVVQASREK